MSTEIKGRTVGVYAPGEICEAWEQQAEKLGISVARYGAQAVTEKLERDGALPHQLSKEERVQMEARITLDVLGEENLLKLLREARQCDFNEVSEVPA